MTPSSTFITMIALTLATVLTTGTPAVAQEVTPARVDGANRYDTAADAMTKVAYQNGTGTAVVATGTSFPDALAAAALAGQADAALLLTRPDTVPTETGTALDELGVNNVYVLGGEGAVSRSVMRSLDTDGRDVTRLGGSDRYATAARVAREVDRLGALPQVNGQPAAFLATGQGFADAVAAGAPAAADAAPVLLTRSGTLPQVTERAIEDLGIGHLWVLGGEAAVSAAVVSEVENLGVEVERIAGSDRQETAVAVARHFVASAVLDGGVVTLARGDDFPDALTGGVTAAATGGPVLLTRSPSALGEAAERYLRVPAAEITVVRAMGGPAAVSRAVLAEADAAAEDGHTAPAPQSWTLSPQQPVGTNAGEAVDFRLSAPGADLPDEVVIALFPCTNVDATGDRRFNDDDNDRRADDLGSTNTGFAAIAVVNGSDIPDSKVVHSASPEDGKITFRLFSRSADCTVPVVFEDLDGDRQLDVNYDGRPTEPYNLGMASWQ